VSGSCTAVFTGVGAGNATVTGTYGGDSTHNGSSGTSNVITVTVQPPAFVHGKVSWTHHLSLAKSSGVQTFTAHVEDMATAPVYVQVVINGSYDNGKAFIAMSAVTLLDPGLVTDITFTAPINVDAIGFKIQFTASLVWGTTATSLPNPGANTKSGAFAVVP